MMFKHQKIPNKKKENIKMKIKNKKISKKQHKYQKKRQKSLKQNLKNNITLMLRQLNQIQGQNKVKYMA